MYKQQFVCFYIFVKVHLPFTSVQSLHRLPSNLTRTTTTIVLGQKLLENISPCKTTGHESKPCEERSLGLYLTGWKILYNPGQLCGKKKKVLAQVPGKFWVDGKKSREISTL